MTQARRQSDSLRLLVGPFLLRRLKRDVTRVAAVDDGASGGSVTGGGGSGVGLGGGGGGGVAGAAGAAGAGGGSGGAFERFRGGMGAARSGGMGGTLEDGEVSSQNSGNENGSDSDGGLGGGGGGGCGMAALPPKTEQVLFCRLSAAQRQLYEELLKSKEMGAVRLRCSCEYDGAGYRAAAFCCFRAVSIASLHSGSSFSVDLLLMFFSRRISVIVLAC